VTRRRLIAALVVTWVALAVPFASAQDKTMVVYLPSTPNESATRVAGSVTALASYLSERAGVRIEVKAFRRAEDATAYLATSAGETALVLADQSLLLDLPQGFDVQPAYRFVRGGRDTRRKLVVVRSDGPATLAALRGKSIAVAAGTGRGSAAYLARTIFGGELDPARWFSRIAYEPDDFSATTTVLFGRADAAIVSEDNPLLAAHLGKDLKEIYASRPVTLPILAISEALPAAQRSAIDQALAGLARAPEAQAVNAGLGIERLQRIPDGERAGFLRVPAGAARTMEIAAPPLAVDVPKLPPLSPDQLPFFLVVDVLDVPIPVKK
jgi:ABC-type phosphate/phosphonate transport system substrate-binding protein